jgi:phage terminase small subunit
MQGFPKPPTIANLMNSGDPKHAETLEIKVKDVDNSLTADETAFILDKFLTKTQRNDPKILAFILSYLECRNAAQSARKAGFESSQGTNLRNKPEIHGAITALTEKAVMKYGYDAEEIIERVKEIATVDPIEFENPDGSYKTHLSLISPELRRAIKKFKVKNIYGEDPNGMKVVTGQLVEVEMWDKLKSLELLGREKNIMKETKKIEHDVTKEMASVLLDSERRAEARITAAKPVIEISGRVFDEESE